MNTEKLKKLQSQVRIGGKGTPRRKKKVVHSTQATDDKKLQSSLKKLSVNTIPGIEEVNMIKDDGSVIHFNNPKTQASLAANTFAITGHGENKQITDMLPGILSQLGPEGITQLKRLANTVANTGGIGKIVPEEEEDVPDLVENFDEASKAEVAKKEEEKPVTEKPVTEKPVIEKPVIEKPVIEKPVIEKPVTEKPVTEKPVTEKPVTEKPVTEKPVTEKPVTEKPNEN